MSHVLKNSKIFLKIQKWASRSSHFCQIPYSTLFIFFGFNITLPSSERAIYYLHSDNKRDELQEFIESDHRTLAIRESTIIVFLYYWSLWRHFLQWKHFSHVY